MRAMMVAAFGPFCRHAELVGGFEELVRDVALNWKAEFTQIRVRRLGGPRAQVLLKPLAHLASTGIRAVALALRFRLALDALEPLLISSGVVSG